MSNGQHFLVRVRNFKRFPSLPVEAALFRRYSVWIVGHGPTLAAGDPLWKELIADAKKRRCYRDALTNGGKMGSRVPLQALSPQNVSLRSELP